MRNRLRRRSVLAVLGAPAVLAGPAVICAPLAAAPVPEVPRDVTLLRSRALRIPVSGVDATQLVDTYTAERRANTGAANQHEALDIPAPRGTPVLAADDGYVAKLFLSKPGGVTLYQFDAGNEFVFYYAHLDRYAEGIREGQRLRKGQLIGYVGTTGNAPSDTPHLHFAVLRLGAERRWWEGKPLNPYLLWRGPR